MVPGHQRRQSLSRFLDWCKNSFVLGDISIFAVGRLPSLPVEFSTAHCLVLGRQQGGTACMLFPLVWRGASTARHDKYTEVHLPTKAPNRRCLHTEAWDRMTYGQIKHPAHVLAMSLNLTRTEKMAPLYADVLMAWLTMHPKPRTDVWRLSGLDCVDYSGCFEVSANFMVAVFRVNDLGRILAARLCSRNRKCVGGEAVIG